MKCALFALLFSLILIPAVMAQSGRKAMPTAKPSPVPQPDDPSEFSESKPRQPRARSTYDRIPSKKTETKAKTASPNVNSTPEPADDGETLRVETNLITIPVSVFDRNGLYIPGLGQQDFKIFEDGVEQEIAYFGTDDKPFTVALILDMSLSSEYKIEAIRTAASAFVEKLGPQDKVVVIDFNSGIHVRTPPTQDKAAILKAISKADFGSGTSLYNAVDEGQRKQLGHIAGRKAIVLFTDGVDTTSRKNSYDSTLNFAEESDSLIFPIYYNTYFDVQRKQKEGVLMAGTSAAEYALGKKYLEDLADATGGRVFRPESTPGGLTAAFEGIAEELRRQYNIGYIPKNEGRPGQRKQIRVRVNRPNLAIRARDSYIVGSTTTAPVAVPAPK